MLNKYSDSDSITFLMNSFTEQHDNDNDNEMILLRHKNIKIML